MLTSYRGIVEFYFCLFQGRKRHFQEANNCIYRIIFVFVGSWGEAVGMNWARCDVTHR